MEKFVRVGDRGVYRLGDARGGCLIWMSTRGLQLDLDASLPVIVSFQYYFNGCPVGARGSCTISVLILTPLLE